MKLITLKLLVPDDEAENSARGLRHWDERVGAGIVLELRVTEPSKADLKVADLLERFPEAK